MDQQKTRPEPELHSVINNGNVNGCSKEKVEKPQESGEDESGSFWTVCPYCFYMYEYERMYEECGLRCQNCRRVFHGVVVVKGPLESDGKEEFNCGFGVFPLKYGYLCDKKVKSEDKSGCGGDNVVVISDDSDEEEGMSVRSGGGGGEEKNVGVEAAKEEVVKGGYVGGVMQGSGKIDNDGKREMKVKSVAKNSKKIMGKGVKSRRVESMVGPKMGGVELSVEFGNGAAENGNGIWPGSGSGNGNGVGGSGHGIWEGSGSGNRNGAGGNGNGIWKGSGSANGNGAGGNGNGIWEGSGSGNGNGGGCFEDENEMDFFEVDGEIFVGV